MTLTEITNAANDFTDENFRTSIVMSFVNEAISIINTETKAKLPYFSDAGTDYTALSNDWIRALLVPYASYGIKQNDGSLNEARIFLNSFNRGFQRLLENKTSAIGATYQGDDFGGIYLIQTKNAINIGWFDASNEDDGFE